MTYSINTDFNTSFCSKNLHKHCKQLCLIRRHLHLASAHRRGLHSQFPQNLKYNNFTISKLIENKTFDYAEQKVFPESSYLWFSNIFEQIIIETRRETDNLFIAIFFVTGNNKLGDGTTPYNKRFQFEAFRGEITEGFTGSFDRLICRK